MAAVLPDAPERLALVPFTIGGRAFVARIAGGLGAHRLRRAFGRSSSSSSSRRPMTLEVESAQSNRGGRRQRVGRVAEVLRLAAREIFPEHLLVHAAAIVGARGAVLFVGSTGVGKTTIAAVAARLGLGVLADDVACIRVADRMVLPSPTSFRVRRATERLIAPPRRRPPVAECAPLVGLVLLGAGRRSTVEVLGRETLLSALPPELRWEAALQIAHAIEGVAIQRMPSLRLDDARGVERARARLHAMMLDLGVSPLRIERALSARRRRR